MFLKRFNSTSSEQWGWKVELWVKSGMLQPAVRLAWVDGGRSSTCLKSVTYKYTPVTSTTNGFISSSIFFFFFCLQNMNNEVSTAQGTR